MKFSYDEILFDLKKFLSQSPEWKDVNLDGSGVDLIVRTIAYGIHRSALTAAAIGNESFIDTVQNRKNLFKLFSHVGYVPALVRAAKATVNISFTEGVDPIPDPVTIPAGTEFVGSVVGGFDEDKIFVLTEDLVIDKGTSSYDRDNVSLVQGEYKVAEFVSGEHNYYKIYGKIDPSFINVYVKAPSGNVYDVYRLATDLNRVSPDDKVFYLTAHEDGYSVYFGKDVLGKEPEGSSHILVSYVESDGEDGNGYNEFSFSSSPNEVLDTANWSVFTVSRSSGGKGILPDDMMKREAKNLWNSQNRIVSIDDVAPILKQKLGVDCFAWDGRNFDPPVWGRLYVSPVPDYGYKVSEELKRSIIEVVEEVSGVSGTKVDIVDPDFVKLKFHISLLFDDVVSHKDRVNIADQVRSKIERFIKSNIGFGLYIHSSVITDEIMDVSDYIKGAEYNFGLEKQFPIYNRPISLSGSFGMPIIPKSFSTIRFVLKDGRKCSIVDDGNGTLKLVLEDESFGGDVGYVDYESGKFSCSPLFFDVNIDGEKFVYCSATPVNNFIKVDGAVLVTTDYSNVKVTTRNA